MWCTPPSLKSFRDVRNDIHVTDGISLKDNRLVIPSPWKTDILQDILQCKNDSILARHDYEDIEEIVSSCEKCMKYQSKQPKEPMQTHDVPLLPWQTVGSNILEHKNQNYLVVIDYYSKYIEALQLKGEASQNVIISMLIGVAWKSQQSFPLIASQMALQKRLYTLSKTC